MKLTPEIKKRIDNYFSNISEEEYEEIVTNYFINFIYLILLLHKIYVS